MYIKTHTKRSSIPIFRLFFGSVSEISFPKNGNNESRTCHSPKRNSKVYHGFQLSQTCVNVFEKCINKKTLHLLNFRFSLNVCCTRSDVRPFKIKNGYYITFLKSNNPSIVGIISLGRYFTEFDLETRGENGKAIKNA